jgi:hypothetical protein
MIRIASAPAPKSTPDWHAIFVKMLPAITSYAREAFRRLAPEAKAVQEDTCIACAAFARLVELNKTDLAYPTVLARYAVAQVRDGRKVGCKLNIRDVLSPYCQQRKNVLVEHLDKFDETEGCWLETIVEDRHAGPSETARVRMDFGDWLGSLPRRNRGIAESLALGNRISDVAKRFHLSAGRVSQVRRELADSWRTFVDEPPTPGDTATAIA